MLSLFLAAASAAPPAELEVTIEKLRNVKGVVHLCLTRNVAHFPDCGSDPQALKRTAPVGEARTISFKGVEAGTYALSVFHDENRNGKLDTFLKIPKEGFGFSRNPVIRFGAPSFAQVRFDMGSGFTRQTVRMQYLL